MSVEDKVQRHFHADARRFDAIYEDERKGPFARFVDNVWRGVVRRRLELTQEKLTPVAGQSYLDVGCGSGRFSLAFAQQGAARVVGVDFAQAMIDIARQAADKLGVADRCDFRAGAFPEAVPEGGFDYSMGLGFFDYVADPLSILVEMRKRTGGKMALSFPKKWEWRIPLRKVRFWMSGCPLYLYTEPQVRKLLQVAGIEKYEWIVLDRDYFVVADMSGGRDGQ